MWHFDKIEPTTRRTSRTSSIGEVLQGSSKSKFIIILYFSFFKSSFGIIFKRNFDKFQNFRSKSKFNIT